MALGAKKLPLKIQQKHTILKEFHPFLQEIAKISLIQRVIPGRINRKQSGSSTLRISFAYFTDTGLKYNLAKWSTAQELFIVCEKGDSDAVFELIEKVRKE